MPSAKKREHFKSVLGGRTDPLSRKRDRVQTKTPPHSKKALSSSTHTYSSKTEFFLGFQLFCIKTLNTQVSLSFSSPQKRKTERTKKEHFFFTILIQHTLCFLLFLFFLFLREQQQRTNAVLLLRERERERHTRTTRAPKDAQLSLIKGRTREKERDERDDDDDAKDITTSFFIQHAMMMMMMTFCVKEVAKKSFFGTL